MIHALVFAIFLKIYKLEEIGVFLNPMVVLCCFLGGAPSLPGFHKISLKI